MGTTRSLDKLEFIVDEAKRSSSFIASETTPSNSGLEFFEVINSLAKTFETMRRIIIIRTIAFHFMEQKHSKEHQMTQDKGDIEEKKTMKLIEFKSNK